MKRKPRLIIALDPPPDVDAYNWAIDIIESTRDLVAGYEVGLTLLVKLRGLEELKDIINAMKNVELKIADFKLADISDMMLLAVEPLVKIGFNAFTAHAFIGYDKGLKELSEYLASNNARLLTIVSMSHPGGVSFLDPVLDKLLGLAVRANSWGIIAPATRPWVIRKARRLLEDYGWRHIKIISPGIGIQGAKPGDGLLAGADYEVVGRLITRDIDPRNKAMEVVEIHQRIIERVEEMK
ncbi:orotidine 5'-phosphate decarboxylase [Desulfurococcaceae archaeon MEX13E-LK6-19]|nr:orotidine 5'-phosphate decarboxylase [Desulfurococcaceae archaeon MEX13E-LK6-19]